MEVLCRVKSKAETKKTKTTKQKAKNSIILFSSDFLRPLHIHFAQIQIQQNRNNLYEEKRCIKSKVYGYSIMQLFLATLNVNSNKWSSPRLPPLLLLLAFFPTTLYFSSLFCPSPPLQSSLSINRLRTRNTSVRETTPTAHPLSFTTHILWALVACSFDNVYPNVDFAFTSSTGYWSYSVQGYVDKWVEGWRRRG